MIRRTAGQQRVVRASKFSPGFGQRFCWGSLSHCAAKRDQLTQNAHQPIRAGYECCAPIAVSESLTTGAGSWVPAQLSGCSVDAFPTSEPAADEVGPLVICKLTLCVAVSPTSTRQSRWQGQAIRRQRWGRERLVPGGRKSSTGTVLPHQPNSSMQPSAD